MSWYIAYTLHFKNPLVCNVPYHHSCWWNKLKLAVTLLYLKGIDPYLVEAREQQDIPLGFKLKCNHGPENIPIPWQKADEWKPVIRIKISSWCSCKLVIKYVLWIWSCAAVTWCFSQLWCSGWSFWQNSSMHHRQLVNGSWITWRTMSGGQCKFWLSAPTRWFARCSRDSVSTLFRVYGQ